MAADSLTHLMGLAGESLVEARRLRPFVDSMLALKRGQTALCENLQAIENRLSAEHDSAIDRNLAALSSARQEATRCRQMLNDKLEEFEDFARRIEDLSGRLHHEVIASRVRPLSEGVRSFPRLVRDVARQLGKKVQFEVRGGKTGVDRDILEKLESPLTHLIRNALDHGIETPERRVEAGKPETGTIRLEARHRAGRLLITLCDDGRGVDPEQLRARVVERGLAVEEMAEKLSEAELYEFLFLPGFTTKEEVTDLSGRGVGLDVVQSMVQAVGGTVRISSQLGKETCFTLHLPITMSVIRALLVRIGGEPYAFPLARIDRILVIPRSDLRAWRAASTSSWTTSRSAWSRRPRSWSCHPPRSRTTTSRWSSSATAATASAWWSTASWASATCRSGRWTPGWARCPTSAPPRCSRTAGRS